MKICGIEVKFKEGSLDNLVDQITARLMVRSGHIEGKVHYGGRVVSIGLIGDDGKKAFTLGIAMPGEYSFVANLGAEHTNVLWGEAYFNNRRITYVGGQTSITPMGSVVRIQAKEPFAYFCRFVR